MRLLPLITSLLLSACAGDGNATDSGAPVDPCEASSSPTLDIGLGYIGYEAIDEGDAFPLIHGPQGGFHLEIGLFATGIAADELVSGEMHGYVDGVELASAFPRLDLRCVTSGRESYGTLLVYNAQPEELDQKETRITVSVTGTDGSVVETEGTYIIDDTQGIAPF